MVSDFELVVIHMLNGSRTLDLISITDNSEGTTNNNIHNTQNSEEDLIHLNHILMIN